MKSHTLAEFQQRSKAHLHLVLKDVTKKILTIEDIGDYIPGSVMVQDLGIMTNTYMNQNGCNFLRQSSEELFMLGEDYFKCFFPADEIKVLKPELHKFVLEGDRNKNYSFFQRVRPNSKSDYTWYHTTSQLYPSKNAEDSLKMVHIAIEANMLCYAGKKLNNLVVEDAFVHRNYHLFNLLTAREKEIITLIVGGESSIKIANLLFLSIHTVNNHRKNIANKLKINCLSQLIKFAVSFGIV
ncbi:MAG: hypothetical protein JWP67_452 [Mucilaginibacter sp.]|nr:hypothetical protein [Mucilaginibacter sp.]